MSSKNKSNLTEFLLADWIKILPRKTMENQSVIFGQEKGKAMKITKSAVRTVDELESDHEEADSRMTVHARYAVEHEGVGCLKITSPDMDVAVLCIFHNALLQNEEFWFHTSTSKKGGLSQFTNLHQSCQKKSVRFYQFSTHRL